MKKIYTLKYTNNVSGKEYFTGGFFVSKTWAEKVAEDMRNMDARCGLDENIEVIECELDEYDPDKR